MGVVSTYLCSCDSSHKAVASAHHDISDVDVSLCVDPRIASRRIAAGFLNDNDPSAEPRDLLARIYQGKHLSVLPYIPRITPIIPMKRHESKLHQLAFPLYLMYGCPPIDVKTTGRNGSNVGSATTQRPYTMGEQASGRCISYEFANGCLLWVHGRRSSVATV